MQLHPLFLRFAVAGALGVAATPAFAQTGGNTNLSDVSGPFLGNVQTSISPLPAPTSVSTSTSSLDTLSREVLLAPPEAGLNEVLKICLQLAANMDAMSPFSGCSDVNWAAYNRAVRNAKQLKRELLRAVQAQKTMSSINAAPAEREAMTQRLELLEKTTSALEGATTTLAAFQVAFDRAR